MRQDVSTKNRVEGRTLASGDLGRRSLLSPYSEEPGASEQDATPTSKVRTALPPRLGIRIKSKLHGGCENPLKAVTPLIITQGFFYFRVKRKRGDGEVEKTSDLNT